MGLIFLTGMPGAGKTTVGNIVAHELQYSFVDLDEDIERRAGKSIPQIFSDDGESAFRDCESAALADACQIAEGVIALGAGALEREDNFKRVISCGTLVYLRAPMKKLVERNRSVSSRPLLAKTDSDEELRFRLRDLLRRRQERYLAARVIVDESLTESPAKTAEKILWELKHRATG